VRSSRRCARQTVQKPTGAGPGENAVFSTPSTAGGDKDRRPVLRAPATHSEPGLLSAEAEKILVRASSRD